MRKTIKTSGFTLIELLVVIAIIAILAAILFPVFVRAKASSQVTACLNNLKQWGSAVLLYTDDYQGRFPWAGPYRCTHPGQPAGKGALYDVVGRYTSRSNALKWCPLVKSQPGYALQGYGWSYWYNCSHTNDPRCSDTPESNLCGYGMSSVTKLSKKPSISEAYPIHRSADNGSQYYNVNFVYLDGHARTLQRGAMDWLALAHMKRDGTRYKIFPPPGAKYPQIWWRGRPTPGLDE